MKINLNENIIKYSSIIKVFEGNDNVKVEGNNVFINNKKLELYIQTRLLLYDGR